MNLAQASGLDLHVALKQIKDAGVSERPQWHALLQLNGNRKTIRDPEFYSSRPFETAQDELESFVTDLYSLKGFEVACRFPARYIWLKNEMDIIDLPVQNCSGLSDFVQKAPMEKASVVFATENISQPSSMMGHVFLKIEGNNFEKKYVAHAISFFTDLDDLNLITLIAKSIFIGKRGFYTLGPYEENKNHYLFNEQRNIWEMQLALTEKQRLLLHYSLYELKTISFTYYFHKFNCATLTNNLIGIIHPDVRNQDPMWTTPVDVVRNIDKDGYIASQKLIPASKWKVKALQENLRLSADVKRNIKKREFESLSLESRSKDEQVLTLELAMAYNDFQFEQDEINRSKWSEGYRLLKEKKENTLPGASLEISNFKNPSKSVPDSHVFFKRNRNQDSSRYVLGFLPAAHSLMDDNSQYQSETELKMAELSIGLDSKTGKADVDSFLLYSAISINPDDYFVNGLSGSFRLGAEPRLTGDLALKRTGFLEGGLGKAFRLHRDFDWYVLAKIGYQADNLVSAFASPVFGLIFRQVYNMKLHFEVGDVFYQQGTTIRSANAAQVFRFGNISLAAKIWKNTLLLANPSKALDSVDGAGFELTLTHHF